MDHVVDDVGRLGVRGRLAGLEAAALVDRDVDEHRARLHARTMSRVTRCGAAAPGISTAPMTRSASMTSASMCACVEYSVRSDGAEDRRQFAQALHRTVDHRDVGAQADGHLGRVRARDAAAEDDDLGGRHARHAAEQDAAAAVRLLQAVRADLHGHAARRLRSSA